MRKRARLPSNGLSFFRSRDVEHRHYVVCRRANVPSPIAGWSQTRQKRNRPRIRQGVEPNERIFGCKFYSVSFFAIPLLFPPTAHSFPFVQPVSLSPWPFFVSLSNLPVSLTDFLSARDPAGSFTRRQPTRQNYRRRFFANHRGAGLPTSDRVLRIVQRSRPGNHVSSWKGKNTIQETELMNSDRLPATLRPPGTTKPRRHFRSRKIFS